MIIGKLITIHGEQMLGRIHYMLACTHLQPNVFVPMSQHKLTEFKEENGGHVYHSAINFTCFKKKLEMQKSLSEGKDIMACLPTVYRKRSF